MPTDHDYLESTSQVVSAFIGNNAVRPQELAGLIASVHAALAGLGAPAPTEEPAPELKPAVPIRKSITDEFLVCLDNGKRFKSLKRHLASLGMTPAQYRAKWGLPHDYPMVAPAYAARRSEFAKAVGLGALRRRSRQEERPGGQEEPGVEEPQVPVPVEAEPPPAPVESATAPSRAKSRKRKAAPDA